MDVVVIASVGAGQVGAGQVGFGYMCTLYYGCYGVFQLLPSVLLG